MNPGRRALCRNLTVEASPSRLRDIRRFIEDIAADATLDTERAFDLKVAVSEACANAVEHSGCHCTPLSVTASLDGDHLEIEVLDTGGFHLPTALDHNARTHRGLGLPLMVALMDEVRIARLPQGGTKVILRLRVP
jgi:serine/threonine-protein kinase RsbW